MRLLACADFGSMRLAAALEPRCRPRRRQLRRQRRSCRPRRGDHSGLATRHAARRLRRPARARAGLVARAASGGEQQWRCDARRLVATGDRAASRGAGGGTTAHASTTAAPLDVVRPGISALRARQRRRDCRRASAAASSGGSARQSAERRRQASAAHGSFATPCLRICASGGRVAVAELAGRRLGDDVAMLSRAIAAADGAGEPNAAIARALRPLPWQIAVAINFRPWNPCG